mmetsp:Transcript_10088/g.10216  ORF Transcript_10088/g.10216 Transcript_10088/m.10216 type:complete len:115 (-) Transcript_10088:18-362(-)
MPAVTLSLYRCFADSKYTPPAVAPPEAHTEVGTNDINEADAKVEIWDITLRRFAPSTSWFSCLAFRALHDDKLVARVATFVAVFVSGTVNDDETPTNEKKIGRNKPFIMFKAKN